MVNTNHFRARIEILLKGKGWTFRELAKKLGKSAPRVHDIVERGDPKASTLREIAAALGVAPEDLLEEVTPEEYGEKFLPTFQQNATN